MSCFADLSIIQKIASPNKRTKPLLYNFGIRNSEQLNSFAHKYKISEEEKYFLYLTEIQSYPMQQIAKILGVSRQCVNQKRCNLYRRTIGK